MMKEMCNSIYAHHGIHTWVVMSTILYTYIYIYIYLYDLHRSLEVQIFFQFLCFQRGLQRQSFDPSLCLKDPR